MATPAAIAAASSCFRCISDYEAAVLYLLGLQVGMTDPATIAANATCMSCVPDKQAAILYLLDAIATNGAGGGAIGSVLCAAGVPVAAPTTTCALYVDLTTTALYFWTGAAWQLKV